MLDEVAIDTNAYGPDWESFQGRVILHLMGDAAPLLAPGNGVTEVMINGPDQVFVERGGRIEKTTHRFQDAAAIRALARAILQYTGKRLSPHDLSTEARLPDLSRVHVVQDPAARPFQGTGEARSGICIAIRRFQQDSLSRDDLIAGGSLTREAAAYLIRKTRDRKNIIVSGGTGTGKTTLLNVLSEAMGQSERIIVIEDSSELQIRCPHVVQFEAVQPDIHGCGGIGIRDLFRAALRMRPDRIIVGECRGGEALDMVQAMNSGHSGSLSTVHADSPTRALTRLETLCLMAKVDLPLVAVRRQLGEAINVIVQLERIGRQRLVTAIAEVEETEDMPRVRTIFARKGTESLTRL